MISGDGIIQYLSAAISETDPRASSHWRKFHAEFEFDGESFRGLQGFGGCQRPHTGLKKGYNHLLQSRFRRLGRRFPRFREVNKTARENTARQARAFDLDVLRQVLTVSFLDHVCPGILDGNKTVCVICDGFASMTSLLLACNPGAAVILVNLNKTLLVDLWYLRLSMGNEAFRDDVVLLSGPDSIVELRKRTQGDQSMPRVIALQAANHELLRSLQADLVVNIASMQEMDPAVVDDYFLDFRIMATGTPLYFYCCNREKKQLPDGTISRFSAYPWHRDDRLLVDELCPWHQEYYAFKPPFYRPYDGAHRHRLALITPQTGFNT